jgi:hypothetical protein
MQGLPIHVLNADFLVTSLQANQPVNSQPRA